MENILNVQEGVKVIYKGMDCHIFRVIDTKRVSIQEDNTDIIHTVGLEEISLPDVIKTQKRDFVDLTKEEWETVKLRYEIIEPILKNRGDVNIVLKQAKKAGVHRSTIYRWISWYETTGQKFSLLGERKNGGRGKSRLTKEQEEVINKSIEDVYLNPLRKSIYAVIIDIQRKSREQGIEIPHESTIRRRIKTISEKDTIKARYGAKMAKDKFAPLRGAFPHANTALSVVQIDHTPVDIILVDEVFRNPFNRPYLTLAIDVFSRMVVGIHLSFDPPGASGTGICISNAILPKEIYLDKLGIKGEWGCWGVMETIHVDNAKEFRGNMLRRACENYNINLEFRPPATPEYGGHIERLLGTLSKKIHDLPGTTFSNSHEKSTYKSEKHASLTLEEFEKWIVTYIVNVYHKQIHSGIGMSPEKKYLAGIYGDENNPGIGLPPRLLNERKIRLDFMPYFERSIQKYGIIIDHIYYYSDVLKNYINVRNKSSISKKYLFRRNPKDISVVYFYDPETSEYYEIPYRNSVYPPISIWEYRAAVDSLKKQNINSIDEQSIFDAYQNLEDIEINAVRSTKKMSKNSRRILSKKFNTANDFLDEINKGIRIPNFNNTDDKPKKETTHPKNDYSHLKPYANLDDEAFNS